MRFADQTGVDGNKFVYLMPHHRTLLDPYRHNPLPFVRLRRLLLQLLLLLLLVGAIPPFVFGLLG